MLDKDFQPDAHEDNPAEHLRAAAEQQPELLAEHGACLLYTSALNLKVIMKKSVAPYFFMGFFLVSYLGMTMMGVAAFAIAAAALYLFNDMQKAEVA